MARLSHEICARARYRHKHGVFGYHRQPRTAQDYDISQESGGYSTTNDRPAAEFAHEEPPHVQMANPVPRLAPKFHADEKQQIETDQSRIFQTDRALLR